MPGSQEVCHVRRHRMGHVSRNRRHGRGRHARRLVACRSCGLAITAGVCELLSAAQHHHQHAVRQLARDAVGVGGNKSAVEAQRRRLLIVASRFDQQELLHDAVVPSLAGGPAEK